MKNNFDLDSVIDIITETFYESKKAKHKVTLVRTDYLEFLIQTINKLRIKKGEK